MINDALTRFLAEAKDHYWDTFEGKRNIILSHINSIAMVVRKEIYDEIQPSVEADAKNRCSLCKGTGIMPRVHDVEEYYKD